MILDNIRHYSFYQDSPALAKVLTYMSGISSENFPGESVRLDGDNAFVNPVCFTTKPEDECLFEAHRKYADIHFIVEGCEKIMVSDIDTVTVVKAFKEASDIGFYQGGNGTVCILKPGDFLVCYPHDAHKVAIAVDSPAQVKKLVGKIRV
jgi:YhcH/YjgK/YiaL family protein